MENVSSTIEHTDDFETGRDRELVTVTIRGRSRKYWLNDISAQQSDDIYKNIVLGNEIEKKAAQAAYRNRMISLVVTREDGSAISVDEAASLRSPLAIKLSALASEFIFAKDEEEAKNESSAT